MKQKINVLDRNIAELIAAGEVIERPASVIKELLENSIDSGATYIDIEIKNGGTTYMKVLDDGCGIYREDVPKAFLRHATSKIMGISDLDKIETLGFRGEALASISAVSKVELITKTDDEFIGTKCKVEGLNDPILEDIGCEKGSCFIIKDLFYNVPARKKFLKKDITESNAIASIVDRVALSHPEIAFKFKKDGKVVMETLGNNDLKACIFSVYGKEFSDSLLSIGYDQEGVSIYGFISKKEYSRPNRNMQHFFVNGRYVKTKTGYTALEEAYNGLIMTGKYPSCVLFIETDPSFVDVNVHPAKIEIKFANEKLIFDIIYKSVRTTILSDRSSVRYVFEDQDKIQDKIQNTENNKEEYYNNFILNKEENNNTEEIIKEENNFFKLDIPEEPEEETPKTKMEKTIKMLREYVEKDSRHGYNDVTTLYSPEIEEEYNENNSIIACDLEKDSQEKFIVQEECTSEKLLGEIFDTYVTLQKDNELIIIDKHALHERYIYNKLKEEDKETFSQVLLIPIYVILEKEEYSTIIENKEMINSIGFGIEDYKEGEVLVKSIPTFVDIEDVSDLIIETAGYIKDNRKNVNADKIEWLYKNIACRAAIKAGTRSREVELQDIIKKWKENPDITNCPHGRPVCISISKKDIEKQFKRI